MTVQEMAERLRLKPVNVDDPDREFRGGYTGDLLSWVMGNAQADDVWITIMSNNNVVAVAVLVDVACVILTEGVTLDAGVRELAEKKGVNIYSTEESSFSIGAKLAGLL